MTATMSLGSIVNTKRKATSTLEEHRTKLVKRRVGTLDAFFAPQRAQVRTPAPPSRTVRGRDKEKKPEENGKLSGEFASLSAEQRRVLSMVVEEERSIFFTGSAGTGKSFLLRAMIAALRKKYAKNPELLAVCASTGMAAQNIGGTTIHAWGAVTPGMQNMGKLISCIKTCRPAHRRWKTVKVLIIDEVSMVDGQLFDTLAAIAVELRKKTSRPFGGIQLVVTGDFFQLPPVTKGGKDPFFAFQSSSWKSSIQHSVTLTRVFRQKDNHFINVLNEMRQGAISPEARQTMINLSRPLPQHDGLLPTELFPLRVEVDRANASRMAALRGPAYRFEARDSGAAPPEKRQKLLDNMAVVRVLELKRDAQVMLVKNVDETLVNGSVGRVLGFHRASSIVDMRQLAESNGFVRDVQVGVDGRTPVGLRQLAAPPGAVGRGRPREDDEFMPLIEFRTMRGKEVVLLTRDEFRAEDSEGNLLARRMQVPLVLAWAMSIHKAQGQTIQLVKVDLNKVFERGQSYVALSRAATLEGLQVLGFDARKVMAHPRVIEWSKGLEKSSGGEWMERFVRN